MGDSKKKENADDLMDQGFNDQELEDIMSEIESLEQEFDGDPNAAPKVKKPDPIAEELAASQQEDGPVDAAQDSAPVQNEQSNVVNIKEKLPEQKSVPQQPAPTQQAPKGGTSSSQMDFHLEGEMKLSMSFTVGGKKIYLTVGQQDGLTIDIGNGGKFVLPINDPGKKVG